MNKSILAKIRKCLSLAQSSNSHEAAAALDAAQRLMREHGVSEADAMLSDIAEAITTAGTASNPPQWATHLVNVIERAFGVRCVIVSSRRDSTKMTFIGTGSSAEIAGYAFTVLRRQLTRGRKEYYRRTRGRRINRVRKADIFALGWVEAVSRLVRSQAGSKTDQLLESYMERMYPDLKEYHPKQRELSGADHGALYAGYDAGRAARLHHGVAGTEQRQIGFA